MKEVLKKRSNSFAHKCVKLAIELPKSKLGVSIEGHWISSSASVAANHRAACLGQSKSAFNSEIGNNS